MDPTSVKGIWHSKKQAWAGIDRILPTGGRFGYEEYHNINGNQAKLANYMKHAENEIKTIEAHLPEHDKGFQGKEERKIKLTLDGERNGLDEVEQELGDEHVARDKSAPQMLAQLAQPPAHPRARQAGRVYADNVLYGEGIQGDIRSQGHHSRKWSRKGAEKDMDKYFDSLQAQVEPTKRMALAQKKGVHVWKKRAGDEMDEYIGDLQVACRQPCESCIDVGVRAVLLVLQLVLQLVAVSTCACPELGRTLFFFAYRVIYWTLCRLGVRTRSNSTMRC